MPKRIGELTLYTVEELSELLDIQEITIRKYLREGKLKGRKAAKRWYVTEEAVREYFSQQEPVEEPVEEAGDGGQELLGQPADNT